MNKKIIWGIIVIVILILGYVAYGLTYVKDGRNGQVIHTETDGWKTFTSNSVDNYSIQYPKGSKLSDDCGPGGCNVRFELPAVSSTSYRLFNVNVRGKTDCKSVNSAPISNVVINGVSFIKFDSSESATAQRLNGASYCAVKNDLAYTLSTGIYYARLESTKNGDGFDPNINVDKDKDFNRMISSFQIGSVTVTN